MREKHVIVPLIILIVIIVVTWIVLSNKDDVNDVKLKYNTTIRLRWVHQSQFAGIYWAEKREIFTENNMKVKIEPGGPGINFLQVVATGREDFGIAGAAQIIEARDKGLPVVALAILFQRNPNVFFSKKSSNIVEPKDWIGKKVAVYYGYDIEYLYRAILKINNIDSKLIEEVPATVGMDAFFRDEVDVWAGYKINQPHTAREKGYEVVEIDPDKYGLSVSGDVLFTTEKVIKEKHELVQLMVNSILEGWDNALNSKDEAVDIVLQYDPKLNRNHELSMINTIDTLMHTESIHNNIGWMNKAQWEHMITIWKEYGGIKDDINPNDCFNMEYVKNYYRAN